VAANKQVEALKNHLKVLQNEVKHLQESTDDCSVPLAKAAPTQTTRAVPPPPSPSTLAASGGPALDLTRCKQLTRLVKDCVDKDHFAQHHQTKEGEKLGLDLTKNKSTIGLSYETLTGEVTGVLPRGPADMTKKIAKGDKIISVDGEQCAGNEGRMDKMLLGSDTPGAVTVLRIQNQKTGQVKLLKTQFCSEVYALTFETLCQVQDVPVRRVSVDSIVDQRAMFDLLTRIMNRLKKDKDTEGVGLQVKVIELWNSTTEEAMEQDEACIKNIHKMQLQCDAWLDELYAELESKDASSSAASSFPPAAVAPSSQGLSDPDAVPMTVKMGMDFKAAGDEGSLQRSKFEKDLVSDLATASGVAADRFKIRKLAPGSVLVGVDVYPEPCGHGPSAAEVSEGLARQAHDPSSALRRGKVTSSVSDIALPHQQLLEHAELKRLRAATKQLEKELDDKQRETWELSAKISKLEEQARNSDAASRADDVSKEAAVKQAGELLSTMKKQLEESRTLLIGANEQVTSFKPRKARESV
jgi:hypothetical protein